MSVQLTGYVPLEEPIASGWPSADRVLRALRGISRAAYKGSSGLGLGQERHFTNEKGAGQALTLGCAVVHASALSR